MSTRAVTIDYINWRGERRTRQVLPTGRMYFASTLFHPKPEWLFEARDGEHGPKKWFALSGVKEWKNADQ